MSSPKVAILDIGTNSVHLFITNLDPVTGGLVYVFTKKFPIRLGIDLADSQEIKKLSVQNLCEAIDECKEHANRYGADLKAFATYSLRTAKNAQAVLDRVREKTGREIVVLSGLAEAKAIFIGQQSHFQLLDDPWMMIDIGGGSTEVILGQGNGVESKPQYHSLNLGAVTTSFRYGFLSNRHRGVQLLASKIQKTCRKDQIPEKTSPRLCYGSSGTIKAIGKLHRRLFTETDSLHGHEISLKQLWELQNVLMSWDHPRDIERNSGLSLRRSEVIWAGMTILLGIMHYVRCDKLVISKASVRDGLALKELTN